MAVVAALGAGIWLDIQVRAQFEGKRWAVPAIIYGRSLDLFAGQTLTPSALVGELKASGYTPSGGLTRPGTYRASARGVSFRTRSFEFWDGVEPARRLDVSFAGQSVARLTAGGRDIALARTEPPVIGRIYPHHAEDRVLVRLEDVPKGLVDALIASEDRDFWTHWGLSPRSLARALWANLRAGRTVQGGSTLTQQLAKNFYLSPERTLIRKAREAAMALILEARYDKADILQAYLNEVYLGQQGRRAIHGFGLAARFYFGRPLAELRVEESALLVALVRGASYYDPRRHPERAKRRRNLILQLMADQGHLTPGHAAKAKQRPLGVLSKPGPANSPHPAFVDLVRRQLRRDYREADLREQGLRIFTTLSPLAQRRAEKALSSVLSGLEGRRGLQRLEGAMVVTAADSAEVLAVVGGRQVREPGFNRALDAVRPIGSLVKPAVYLAALEPGAGYTLASPLQDEPVTVRGPKGAWQPKNYDNVSHGQVPMHQALAKSYNLATVRLGLDVGLHKVVTTLNNLGVQRRVQRYPSTLLGSLELAPVEVAQMYQTLAADGFYMPLRAIREVTDARGRPLSKYPLNGRQTVSPEAAYQLRAGLERVVAAGTARYAGQRLPPHARAAGKTGTTDGLRDSWFSGFAGDLVATVWVGRDDNRPAGLTGSAGALRIWTEFFKGLPLHTGPGNQPADIVWAWTSPSTGERVPADCQGAVHLPFLRSAVPAPGNCDIPAFSGVEPETDRRNG